MQILARIIHEPQNIEVKSIVSLLSKTSAVRNSLFDLPAIASRSGEAGGYSIFGF